MKLSVALSMLVPAFLLAVAVGCGTDPSKLDAKELVQGGCNSDDDCPGGTCIAGIGEGLCTAGCSTHDDCPSGTLCIDTESEFDGVCLLTCETNSECSDHLGPEYNCDTESDLVTGEDVRVCIDGA